MFSFLNYCLICMLVTKNLEATAIVFNGIWNSISVISEIECFFMLLYAVGELML